MSRFQVRIKLGSCSLIRCEMKLTKVSHVISSSHFLWVSMSTKFIWNHTNRILIRLIWNKYDIFLDKLMVAGLSILHFSHDKCDLLSWLTMSNQYLTFCKDNVHIETYTMNETDNQIRKLNEWKSLPKRILTREDYIKRGSHVRLPGFLLHHSWLVRIKYYDLARSWSTWFSKWRPNTSTTSR